ncbi:hypothetical protein VTG60DRAFT_6140 [Thermothelomyces hinnuleus]
MPVLSPPSSLEILVGRTVANASDPEPLQVVCSWPLSGQYGGGSRILYYVLVAACVLARKTEWLRNACLAAALIFPATAAIHAIVLASLHTDDAIDMDIYGALQMCSIGILTAPATVRLSRTYFNNPGRNVLFVWTVLVVAGLLALTVEFFRTEAKDCRDSNGGPVYHLDNFPGNTKQNCSLVCEEGNPFSPMRTGSADNINLVPKPYYLTFGAATLVAAASCVPGILSMVSIWNKIAKLNWSKQFGTPDVDEVIEGTNGATPRGMKSVNDVIRRLLSVVEIPVFAGAVLTLIIVGELNFWSPPLFYQIEPIGNIGQWSSIVASVFAAIGSLYMLLAKFLEKAEKEGSIEEPLSHCHCHCMYHTHGSSSPNSLNDNPENAQPPHPLPAGMGNADARIVRHDTEHVHVLSPIRTETFPDNEDGAHGLGIHPIDSNTSAGTNKRGFAEKLIRVATALERVSPDRFDDHLAFKQGKATGFPEIPGEPARNRNLAQIRRQWGEPTVDPEDSLAAPRGRRSRANSFSGSVSRSNSVDPRAHSPKPPPRTPTNGPETSMLGLPTTHSPESTSESVFPERPSVELEKTKSRGTVVTLHEGLNSPAIVLSSDEQENEAQPPTTAPSAIESTQPSGQVEDSRPKGRLAVPAGEGSAQRITAAEHQVPPRATTRLPPLDRQPASHIEQAGRPGGSPSSQTSGAAKHDTPPKQVASPPTTSSPAIEQQPSSSRTKEERQIEAPSAETDDATLKNRALQVPQPTAASLPPVEQRPPLDHVEVEVVRHAEEPSVRTGDASQQDTAPQQSAPPTPAISGLVARRPPLHRVEDSVSDGRKESPASEAAQQHATQKRAPQRADGRPTEKASLPSSGDLKRNQE